jgi:hypothetical protein
MHTPELHGFGKIGARYGAIQSLDWIAPAARIKQWEWDLVVGWIKTTSARLTLMLIGVASKAPLMFRVAEEFVWILDLRFDFCRHIFSRLLV